MLVFRKLVLLLSHCMQPLSSSYARAISCLKKVLMTKRGPCKWQVYVLAGSLSPSADILLSVMTGVYESPRGVANIARIAR